MPETLTTPTPEWHRLDLPFLFVGYFECDHCHRPIEIACRLEGEDDWRERLFDVRCRACGWGHMNYPGSNTTLRTVIEWKPNVRSLETKPAAVPQPQGPTTANVPILERVPEALTALTLVPGRR